MESGPGLVEGAGGGAARRGGGVEVPNTLVRAVCRLLDGHIIAPAGCPVLLDRLFKKVARRRAWYRDRAGNSDQWRELARELGVGKSTRRLDYRALQTAYAESLREIEAAAIEAAYPKHRTMGGSVAPPNVEVGSDGKSFNCAECGNPGEVVMCDWYRCPNVYHPGCLKPGGESCKLLDEGDSAHAWYCPACLKSCTFLLQPGHASPELNALIAPFARREGLNMDQRALLGKHKRRGRPGKGSLPAPPAPALDPAQDHGDGVGMDHCHRAAAAAAPSGLVSGPDSAAPLPHAGHATRAAGDAGAAQAAARTGAGRASALAGDAGAQRPRLAGGVGPVGHPASGSEGGNSGATSPPPSAAAARAVDGAAPGDGAPGGPVSVSGYASDVESVSATEASSASEEEAESGPDVPPGPEGEQYRTAVAARQRVLMQRVRASCAVGADAAFVDRARGRGQEARDAVVQALRSVKRGMLDRARLPNTTTKPAGTVTVDDGLKRAMDVGSVCTPASVARRTLRGLISGFDTRENRIRSRKGNRSGLSLPLLDGVDPRITARRLLTALLTDVLVPSFFRRLETAGTEAKEGRRAAPPRRWLFSDDAHTVMTPALCEAPTPAVDTCFRLAATLAAGGSVDGGEVTGGSGEGKEKERPLTGALSGAVMATRARVQACKAVGVRDRDAHRAHVATVPPAPLELPTLPEVPSRGAKAPDGKRGGKEGKEGKEDGGGADQPPPTAAPAFTHVHASASASSSSPPAPAPASAPSGCSTPPQSWEDYPRPLRPSDFVQRSASVFVRWCLGDADAVPAPAEESAAAEAPGDDSGARGAAGAVGAVDGDTNKGAGADARDDGMGLRSEEFAYHAAQGRQQLMQRVEMIHGELETQARAAANGDVGTPFGPFALSTNQRATSHSGDVDEPCFEEESLARWARQQAAAHLSHPESQWVGLWLRVACHEGLMGALHEARVGSWPSDTVETGDASGAADAGDPAYRQVISESSEDEDEGEGESKGEGGAKGGGLAAAAAPDAPATANQPSACFAADQPTAPVASSAAQTQTQEAPQQQQQQQQQEGNASLPDAGAAASGTGVADGGPPSESGSAPVDSIYARAMTTVFSPWLIRVFQPVASTIAVDMLTEQGRRVADQIRQRRSSRPHTQRHYAQRAAMMAAMSAYDDDDRPRAGRGARKVWVEEEEEEEGDDSSAAQVPPTALAAPVVTTTRKRGRPPSSRSRPAQSSARGGATLVRVSALDRASFVPRDTPSSVLALPTAVFSSGARVRVRLRLRHYTYEPEARSRLGLPRLSETLDELEPVARPRHLAYGAAEAMPEVVPARGSVAWPWRSLGGRRRNWPAFLSDLAPRRSDQDPDERGATVIVAALLSISAAGPAVMRAALGVNRAGQQTGESPLLDPKLLAEAVDKPELVRYILRSVGDAEQRGVDGGAVTAADSNSRVLQIMRALPRVLPQAVAHLSQAAGSTAPLRAANDYSVAHRWLEGCSSKSRQHMAATALLILLSDVTDRAGADAASRAVAELGSSDPRVHVLASTAASRVRDLPGARNPFHRRATPLPPLPLSDVDGLHQAQLAPVLGRHLGPALTVALGPGLLSEVLLVAQSGLHASELQPPIGERLLTLQEAIALRALLTASMPAYAMDAIRARADRVSYIFTSARYLVKTTPKRGPSASTARLTDALARDAQRETLDLLYAVLSALGLRGSAAALALRGKGGAGLGMGLGAVPCGPDELPVVPPEACRPASRALAAEMRRHNPIWNELCGHLRRIQSRLPAHLEEEQRARSLKDCVGMSAVNAVAAATEPGTSRGATPTAAGGGKPAPSGAAAHSNAAAGPSRRRPVVITESVDLFVVWPPELVYGSCLEYRPYAAAQDDKGDGGTADLPLRQQLERDTLQDSVKPAARRSERTVDPGAPPLVWTCKGLRPVQAGAGSQSKAHPIGLPSLKVDTPCVPANELFHSWDPDTGSSQGYGSSHRGKATLGGVPDLWLAMHPEASVHETLPPSVLSYILTRRVRRHRAMVLGQWQESLASAREKGMQRTAQELAQTLGARSAEEQRTLPPDALHAVYSTVGDVLEPALPLPLPLNTGHGSNGDCVGDALADFFPIAAVFDAFPLAFSVPAGTAADSADFAEARKRAIARAKHSVFRAFVRSREVLADQPALWRATHCAACDMGWAHVCTAGGNRTYRRAVDSTKGSTGPVPGVMPGAAAAPTAAPIGSGSAARPAIDHAPPPPPPTEAASAAGPAKQGGRALTVEQLSQFNAQLEAADRLASGRPLEPAQIASVVAHSSRMSTAASRSAPAPVARAEARNGSHAAAGPAAATATAAATPGPPELGRALQLRSAPERLGWDGDGVAHTNGPGAQTPPVDDVANGEKVEEGASVEQRRSQRRGRGLLSVAMAATQRAEALDAMATGIAAGVDNGSARSSSDVWGGGGGAWAGDDPQRLVVPNPNRLSIPADGVAVLSPDPRTMGPARLYRFDGGPESGSDAAAAADAAFGGQEAPWRVPLPARGEVIKYPAASVRRGHVGHLVWTFIGEASAGLRLALCKPAVAWSEVGEGKAEVAQATAQAASRVGRVTTAWLTAGRSNADKVDYTLAVRPSTLRRPQLLVPRDAASEEALYASLAVQRALVALNRGVGKPGTTDAGSFGASGEEDEDEDEESRQAAPLGALRRLLGADAQVQSTWSLRHALLAHTLEGESRSVERAGWARELAGERPLDGPRPPRWGHAFARSWTRHGHFLLQLAARRGEHSAVGNAVELLSSVNPAGCVRALPRKPHAEHKVPTRFRRAEDSKRWLMSVGIVSANGAAGARDGAAWTASAGQRRKTTRRHAGEEPAAKRQRTRAGQRQGPGGAESRGGYLDPPAPISLPWLELRRSRIHNLGLFATRDIEPNCLLTEYVGEIVRPEVADVRERRYQARGVQDYMFRMAHSRIVDATMRGNRGRYINHSCEPNSYAVVHAAKHICIYSARRIKAGEEITYDYQFAPGEESIPCFCGAPSCRGTLNFRDGLD